MPEVIATIFKFLPTGQKEAQPEFRMGCVHSRSSARMRQRELFAGRRQFLKYLARGYGKGEQFFVLVQNFFQRCSVIDNNVVVAEPGFGEVSAVVAAEDLHRVDIPMNLNLGCVYQFLIIHGHPIPYLILH